MATRHPILIVDDTPLDRVGLTHVINQEPDLLVCGSAADTHQGMQMVPIMHPDLIVLDMSLRNGGLLAAIKTLQHYAPRLPVLAVTVHSEVLYAVRALHAGARGYVQKWEDIATILQAIRQVVQGERVVSQRYAAILSHMASHRTGTTPGMPLNHLTDREVEVLHFIGMGYSARQIAERLHVSEKTVHVHRQHLLEKLVLRHARELTLYAVHWIYNINSH